MFASDPPFGNRGVLLACLQFRVRLSSGRGLLPIQAPPTDDGAILTYPAGMALPAADGYEAIFSRGESVPKTLAPAKYRAILSQPTGMIVATTERCETHLRWWVISLPAESGAILPQPTGIEATVGTDRHEMFGDNRETFPSPTNDDAIHVQRRTLDQTYRPLY